MFSFVLKMMIVLSVAFHGTFPYQAGVSYITALGLVLLCVCVCVYHSLSSISVLSFGADRAMKGLRR